MDPTYTTWVHHGEKCLPSVPVEDISLTDTYRMYEDRIYTHPEDDEPAGVGSQDDDDISRAVGDVDSQLYPGCETQTNISAAEALFKLKVSHGLSNSSFDELLQINLKKAEKRAKLQEEAARVIVTRGRSIGLRISDQGSNEPPAPQELPTSALSKKAKGKGKRGPTLQEEAARVIVTRGRSIGLRISDQGPNEPPTPQELPISTSSKKAKGKGKREPTFQEEAARVIVTRGKSIDLKISDQGSNEPPTPQELPISASSKKAKGKGKRGPTRMGHMSTENPKLQVEFNEWGQPIGANSQKFSSYVGVLAREHLPIISDSWHHVDPSIKEELWSLVQQRFIIGDYYKPLTLQMMGKCWRQFKSRLTIAIRDSHAQNGKDQTIDNLWPKNVTSTEEWENFVKERLSDDFKNKSNKFKAIRKNHVLHHTLSRKGYARLEQEMLEENPESSAPSRVDLWTRGHVKKNGEPLNEAISDALAKIKEFTQCSSATTSKDDIHNDAIEKAMGPEHHGRIRGLGFGATRTRLGGHAQNVGRVRELENQMKQLQNKVNSMSKIEERVEELSAMLMQQTQQTQRKSVEPMETSNPPAQGTGSVQQRDPEENAKCHLLHWYSDDPNEVVAEGRISATDPKVRVHHVPLGRDCWQVWVDHAVKPSTELPRPVKEVEVIGEAIGSTVVWPKSCIRLM